MKNNFAWIGRVIDHAIGKIANAIVESRKNYNLTVPVYTPPGDNSVPCKEDRLVIIKIDGTGRFLGAGVLAASQNAQPGEKILFGRNQEGITVSKISLLNDGSIIINTEDETTSDSAGNYTRKIKGVTDIHETGNRIYKNDADVSEEIGGDYNKAIKGSETKEVTGDSATDIDGKFYFGNTTQNLAKILLGIVDDIENLQTFGPPPKHKVSPESITKLEARKNDINTLLKENA
jgi:hypothetical protein